MVSKVDSGLQASQTVLQMGGSLVTSLYKPGSPRDGHRSRGDLSPPPSIYSRRISGPDSDLTRHYHGAYPSQPAMPRFFQSTFSLGLASMYRIGICMTRHGGCLHDSTVYTFQEPTGTLLTPDETRHKLYTHLARSIPGQLRPIIPDSPRVCFHWG